MLKSHWLKYSLSRTRMIINVLMHMTAILRFREEKEWDILDMMIQTSKLVRALLWNCRMIDSIWERFLFSEAFLGVSLMYASKNSRIKTSTFTPKRT